MTVKTKIKPRLTTKNQSFGEKRRNLEQICPITKRELPEFRENAGIWDLAPKSRSGEEEKLILGFQNWGEKKG